MLGERLVNRRAMGVTHGNNRRGRAKALPKKLKQAEPLFGRKFENFGNVGVAHGQ